jgi:hypothetical protein
MALRIKELLYNEQYTIAGAKKKLAGELRPSRESGQATPSRPPPRSLQPPPSLAGRFSALPSSAASTAPAAPPTDDQRATFSRIAKELREILDLLDEGEAGLAATRTKRKS